MCGFNSCAIWQLVFPESCCRWPFDTMLEGDHTNNVNFLFLNNTFVIGIIICEAVYKSWETFMKKNIVTWPQQISHLIESSFSPWPSAILFLCCYLIVSVSVSILLYQYIANAFPLIPPSSFPKPTNLLLPDYKISFFSVRSITIFHETTIQKTNRWIPFCWDNHFHNSIG